MQVVVLCGMMWSRNKPHNIRDTPLHTISRAPRAHPRTHNRQHHHIIRYPLARAHTTYTTYTTHNNAQQRTHATMHTQENNKQQTYNKQPGIPLAQPLVVRILVHANVAHKATQRSDAAKRFACSPWRWRSWRAGAVAARLQSACFTLRCQNHAVCFALLRLYMSTQIVPFMVRWVVRGTWGIGSSSPRLELRNGLLYQDREFEQRPLHVFNHRSHSTEKRTCLT